MVKRLAVMVVLALALTASQAKAGTISILDSCGTLANVIANGCTIGDKAFANVSFSLGTGSDTFFTTNILVTGISDSDFEGDFGFRLTGLDGAPLVTVGGTLIATLAYTVSVLDPLAFLITDLHLGLNTTGSVAGLVTETATDLDTNLVVGVLQGCVNPDPLFCSGLGLTNTDFILVGPTETLGVVKLLNFVSVGGSVDSVDQIVTQQAVPEPASMLLLGTGLAGLAMRRRRRAQQQIQR